MFKLAACRASTFHRDLIATLVRHTRILHHSEAKYLNGLRGRRLQSPSLSGLKLEYIVQA